MICPHPPRSSSSLTFSLIPRAPFLSADSPQSVPYRGPHAPPASREPPRTSPRNTPTRLRLTPLFNDRQQNTLQSPTGL